MKESIYKNSPQFIQNILITLYNLIEYRKRYSGNYSYYFELFKKNKNLEYSELKKIQEDKFKEIIDYSVKNSPFYNDKFKEIKGDVSASDLSKLPIINKEEVRKNIYNIHTIKKKNAIISKTGGTTGKSLEVYFTYDDMQQRFAMLDVFRSSLGYKLGEKTAWFSGKDLLTHRDIVKNRFWKTDYYHRVRYYSTFHIKSNYLQYYILDLIKYKPKFIVGFPSSILEIAKYGISNNYKFPKNTVKSIFPTAETITIEMRETIEKFFHAKMYNQYASSEGAPFIFECEEGNLHLELQSGVFEVLDSNNQPANNGRLIITSFTTKGTPLIRYDIGDEISFENTKERCACGNNNPIVKEINGRIDDFVYSIENGKINLGNVSNTLKDTKGIVKFQVIQNEIDKLHILMVVDKNEYNDLIEKKFIQNWKDRVGNRMNIQLTYLSEIPTEPSGKFRMVKNNIKNIIKY